jgi:hypothetical protein
MKIHGLTHPRTRLPRQHVRICRRPRPSQGRNRPRCHPRGQERTFQPLPLHPPTSPRINETRSLSSGEASPSSSVTAPKAKSRRPKTPSGKPCATRSPMATVFRSPNGSSCWVSARTWDAYPLARPATLAVGSAHATALTTTSQAA